MIAAGNMIKVFAGLAFCIWLFVASAAAQSTDQNFPTPVTTNEIDGTIKARDIGDARVTVYFYAFDGGQGDIFINVVTKNFSGDIDIFSAEALTPLTKMVIYADAGASETGRLIYLRKPDRMILRVEGRTPNDDAATFRIKFGGSFIALAPQKVDEAPTVAKTSPDARGVKVNSVGTIVAVVPKPTPKIEEAPAKEKVVAKAPSKPVSEKPVAKTTPSVKKPSAETGNTKNVFENKKAKVTVEPPPKSEPPVSAGRPKAPTPTAKKPNPTPKKPATETTGGSAKVSEPARESTKPANPLASVRLVIQMKDGTVFWRPMDLVLKFTVDKGIMTIIGKDGSITRYNIFDVEKTTIQ